MDRPGRLTRVRARGLAVAAAALAIAASPPAPRDIAAAAGAWDLSLQGSHRKCRRDAGPRSRRDRPRAALSGRLPAGAADRERARRLAVRERPGSADRPRRQAGLGLRGRARRGGVRRPDRDRRVSARADRQEPPGGQRARPAAHRVPQATPVDPARAPPAETLPGPYWVDRYTEKEVCRIELGRAMLNAVGRFEARLLEACRDAGLAAFDPAAWRSRPAASR